MTAGLKDAGDSGDTAAQDRADYKVVLTAPGARIAGLDGEIANATKTVEGAEALRKEIVELRRKGDEGCVGFELQLVSALNAKAARTLFFDYDNDIERLKVAEPWPFTAFLALAPTGSTGLSNAGVTGVDDTIQISRWHRIAGLSEEKEWEMANGIAYAKNYTSSRTRSTSARRARRA